MADDQANPFGISLWREKLQAPMLDTRSTSPKQTHGTAPTHSSSEPPRRGSTVDSRATQSSRPSLRDRGLDLATDERSVSARTPPRPSALPAESPAKDKLEKRRAYEAALTSGARALWSATGKRRIGWGYPAGKDGEFDRRYWRRVEFRRSDPTQQEGALILISGKPDEAIREIIKRPDLWTMDCATFVQVVQLNALREALGMEEFRRYMNEQKQQTQGLIVLQNHYSTGLIPRWGYSQDEQGIYRQFSPGSIGPVERRTPEQVVSAAPVGSEVVFFNPRAPETDRFRFENAIKIGEDRYLAFPVGDPGISGKNIRTQMGTMFPTAEERRRGAQGMRSAINDVGISTVAVFDFFR